MKRKKEGKKARRNQEGKEGQRSKQDRKSAEEEAIRIGAEEETMEDSKICRTEEWTRGRKKKRNRAGQEKG